MNVSLPTNDLNQEPGDLPPGLVVGLVLRPQSSWQEEFYPEDLPADWQLEYYANEFKSLYLNGECVTEVLLEGLDELEDDFELMLELGSHEQNQRQALSQALSQDLLDRCDSVVLANGTEVTQWQKQLGGRQPVPLEQFAKQWQVQTVDAMPNARELRESIENLMKVAETQRVYCYFDGKAAYATAQQAITIAGLMGVLA